MKSLFQSPKIKFKFWQYDILVISTAGFNHCWINKLLNHWRISTLNNNKIKNVAKRHLKKLKKKWNKFRSNIYIYFSWSYVFVFNLIALFCKNFYVILKILTLNSARYMLTLSWSCLFNLFRHFKFSHLNLLISTNYFKICLNWVVLSLL